MNEEHKREARAEKPQIWFDEERGRHVYVKAGLEEIPVDTYGNMTKTYFPNITGMKNHKQRVELFDSYKKKLHLNEDESP